MHLPNLDDFLPEQLDALRAPADEDLFIVGPPGSGKTSIAVQRAIAISKQGKRTLLVTKNRMLASLARRLGGNTFNTATMHSFVWGDYEGRFSSTIPTLPHDRYRFAWPIVLKKYQISPTVAYDHIIVDEGQNLPAGFYPWVVKYGGEVTSVFADEDQTTDSENARIEDIRKAPMPPERYLRANHRNTLEIAQVAEFFHTSKTVAAGMVPDHKRGNKPALIQFTDWQSITTRIATRFRNRRTSIGIIVDNLTTAKIFQTQLGELLGDIKPRIDLYENSLSYAVVNNIDITVDGITILTGQSAIGLEFDCVYLQDLPRQPGPLSLEAQRKMYMLCARAKKELFLIDGPTPMGQTALTNLPDENTLTR